MAYGILPTGFVRPTFDELRIEVEADLRGSLGASLVLGDISRLGKIIAVVVNQLDRLWQALELVVAAGDPDNASGTLLEAIAAITGTLKRPATRTQGFVIAAGTSGATILAGSLIATESTNVRFTTDADATLVTATAWATSTVYTVGQIRRTLAGNVYICEVAGTSLGSGNGPNTTSPEVDFTDNTVTWRWVGTGTLYAEIAVSAVELGPILAVEHDLNVIQSPTVGWSTVINPDDLYGGRKADTDATLRLRRLVDLYTPGSTPRDAIREALSDTRRVPGVLSVTVFHNTTDATVDGMPPHSVEALVLGGTDADIANTLYANIASGIRSHGNTTVVIQDSQGVDQSISFSRPEEIPIYVDLDLIVSEDFPVDGEDQVKAAIVAYGQAQKTGKNAVARTIGAQSLTVVGVLDFPLANISVAPSPTVATTIAIGPRQLATFATGNITIDNTVEEP